MAPARDPSRFRAGATVTDLQGAVVTAGFWNSHVHFMPPPLLNAEKHSSAEIAPVIAQMLSRWGFTTVFDVASPLSNTLTIRRRIEAGEISGPAILTVGDPFFPKNGTPIYVRQFMKDNGFPNEEITDLPAAVARVHRQIHDGADGIKLFAGAIVGGDVGVLPMPLDQARALVAASHADGKPVFAHPTNLDGLNVAIDSGVDILAHTTPDGGPWPPELTSRILAHHMALIPTLTLFEVELKKILARRRSGIEALHRYRGGAGCSLLQGRRADSIRNRRRLHRCLRHHRGVSPNGPRTRLAADFAFTDCRAGAKIRLCKT